MEKRTRRRSSKIGAKTEFAMTLSVAKKTNAFSVGDNRACSDERGRENKCGGSEGTGIGDGSSSKKGPLCYGGR